MRMRGFAVVVLALSACEKPAPDAVPSAASASAAPPTVAPPADLVAGGAQTCALIKGAFRCWGPDWQAKLEEKEEGLWKPSAILPGQPFPAAEGAKVALGHGYLCAVGPDTTVRCWGKIPANFKSSGYAESVSALEVGTGVVDVAAGGGHACLRMVDGSVRCWGFLWGWDWESKDPHPRQEGIPYKKLRSFPSLAGAVELALGEGLTCGRMADGAVLCAGIGNHGQHGDGAREARWDAAAVPDLPPAVAIAAAGAHVCALGADGALRCWGDNRLGQIGDGTSEDRLRPVEVKLPGRARAMALGAGHTCALVEGGEVLCWGAGYEGALGDGKHRFKSETPVRVVGMPKAKALVAGGYHTCARAENDTIWCWGANQSVAFGDDSREILRAPVEAVRTLAPTKITPRCKDRGSTPVDLDAWKRELAAAADEETRAQVLARLGMRPVPDSKDLDISEECAHTPKLEGVDVIEAKLEDDRDHDTIVIARYSSCAPVPADPTPIRAAHTWRVQILRQVNGDEYCFAGDDLSGHQEAKDAPCKPSSWDKKGSDPSPIGISFQNLTCPKHSTVRVDLVRGTGESPGCVTHRSTMLYDVTDRDILRLFAHEMFSDTMSSYGETTRSSLSASGKYPKDLELLEEVICEPPKAGRKSLHECKPKKTKTLYRMDRYRYAPAWTHPG